MVTKLLNPIIRLTCDHSIREIELEERDGMRWKSWFGRAALVAAAPVVLGATSFDTNLDQRLLAAHNRERSALGIAPLRWNPELASAAQAWGQQISALERLQHAPASLRRGQGENLWAGTKGFYAPEAMVDAWVREKKHFKPGAYPDNSITNRASDVGHYTQLVWRATSEVGCAVVTGPARDVLVCRYASPGNVIGSRPF